MTESPSKKPEVFTYQKLKVWQDAMSLAADVYKYTSRLPASEKYGLSTQMQRAAISIPSNIAEGKSRGGDKFFAQFLKISLGSTAELETQLMLSQKVTGYSAEDILIKTEAIKRMLWGLLNRINHSNQQSYPQRLKSPPQSTGNKRAAAASN